MIYFTDAEFKAKYTDYASLTIQPWEIEAVCEMIYSQIGLSKRYDWTSTTVPLIIKNASMEQMRFMIEHSIPFVDMKDTMTAGTMTANLSSDYSTLALRMLANGGYLYRGVPLGQNMGINIGFGG